LTSWAWRAAGVSLPRTAQAQYNATRHIPVSALMPGDLVFYGSPGGIYHVGIYVGGGQMIHAPHSGTVVSYISINFAGLLGGGRI
jgi:cell wall-associated NlpC family hydrolase